jgi:hypothetical protein
LTVLSGKISTNTASDLLADSNPSIPDLLSEVEFKQIGTLINQTFGSPTSPQAALSVPLSLDLNPTAVCQFNHALPESYGTCLSLGQRTVQGTPRLFPMGIINFI